jgi:hypothetical protein
MEGSILHLRPFYLLLVKTGEGCDGGGGLNRRIDGLLLKVLPQKELMIV